MEMFRAGDALQRECATLAREMWRSLGRLVEKRRMKKL